MPQSIFTELCSQAAAVPQSLSIELCSSAAVVPQSKSTEMWSSAAPFHHDLWYFRHRTNEHLALALCYIFGKTYKPADSSAALKSLKSTHSTKLLKKLLTWSHTFHRRLWWWCLEACGRCSVSELVFKHDSLCSSAHHKKCGLGSLISTQVKNWRLASNVSFNSKVQ